MTRLTDGVEIGLVAIVGPADRRTERGNRVVASRAIAEHATCGSLWLYAYAMDMQGITIDVSSLQRSRQFYEGMLGFRPGEYYAETKWLPYQTGNQFFAIREISPMPRRVTLDMAEFWVDDVEALWGRLKDEAEVVQPLAKTPWGSYKFILQDPDGYHIGLVQKRNP